MNSKGLAELPELTRKAIKEFPKTWSQFGKDYIQKITKRDLYRLNVTAAIVGIVCGYAAIGFRWLIGFIQNTLLHAQWDYHLISPIDHVRGYWMYLIVPSGLLISAMLTEFFAKEAKGHGVPEVIEAVLLRGGKMRKRIVALKALASSVTIASGGSVGREGPIVQIGSAAGSTIGQLFKFESKLLKTLVGCGAAGAVAATFNTPIAGVIFAIEIIVLELKTKSFVPLVIASVMATVVSRAHLGNEPAFKVPEHSLTGPNELIFYLFFGIIAGVVGVIVIRSVYGIEDFVGKIKVPFWIKSIVGGLILAGIGQFYPAMYGVGYETVSEVLLQDSTLSIMLLFVFLKIFCTSLTLACGGSGGVFAPSLFIGAMLGGSYGYVINHFFPEVTVGYGAYALVGMAALFSATGRATFTAIVILFEMTLDYSIILPLMFVCVLADQVAWALSKDSIYSMKLKRKGLNFITDISVNIMSITLVKDIMTTELHIATEEMTLKQAADHLLKYDHTVFPVIGEDKQLMGVLNKACLEHDAKEKPQALVKEFMKESHAVVNPNDTVQWAMTKLENSRDPRILVVEQKSKKLLGIVSPIDFVRLSSADVES